MYVGSCVGAVVPNLIVFSDAAGGAAQDEEGNKGLGW